MALRSLDLMIGDWIEPHQCRIPTVYARVEGIYPDGITIDKAERVFSFDEIHPIPLTPEVLEKNGFENIGDDTYQLEEKPCWFLVDFFNHQYGCEYDTSTYEYEDDEHRLKLYGIPSVHQLQHALRLCGIEKEIIL